MYDTPVGRAVRFQLQDIAGQHGASNASAGHTLRQTIFEAVDELKSMGWPIERIIIRLKVVANEVGLSHHTDAARHDRESVVSQLVTWSIERYYGDRT